MSNDAKLGLVLGVAIVVVIGLVFFRADPPLAAQAPIKNGVFTTSLPTELTSEPRTK
jgi:hypothetical protein